MSYTFEQRVQETVSQVVPQFRFNLDRDIAALGAHTSSEERVHIPVTLLTVLPSTEERELPFTGFVALPWSVRR